MTPGTPTRRRKHWGWGFEDEQPPIDQVRAAAGGIVDVLGLGSAEVAELVAAGVLVARDDR